MTHDPPAGPLCSVVCGCGGILNKEADRHHPQHTHLVGRQEAEVEGRVGDHVPLGALSGAQDHIVPQSE